MKDLSKEMDANIALMRVRYTHKVIPSNHVIMIRSREWPLKSEFLQSLDKLRP